MSERSYMIATALWWDSLYREMGGGVDWDAVMKEINEKWPKVEGVNDERG